MRERGTSHVSDRVGQVGYIFGPQVTIPVVSTGGFAFANAQRTSAALGGSVDPEGTAVGGCGFEYGPNAFYGSRVPCSDESRVRVTVRSRLALWL